MTDDDRRLADRLRGYESRIPATEGVRLAVRPARFSTGILTAAAGVLAVAAIVGISVLRSEPAIGEASPTPIATPSADASTPEPSPERTASPTIAAPATPESTAEPTPTAAPGPIAGWRMTASFDTDPATSSATDVIAWDGGFVAIGGAWTSANRIDREMPRIWTSSQGETWTEQPIDLGVKDASLKGIARRGDGLLLLVGSVPGSSSNPDALAEGTRAWISDDAQQWTPVPLPLNAGLIVDSFTHGPMGYALTAGGELWHSADAITWTRTYEGAEGVVAGQEGFVAVILREEAAEEPHETTLIASGDGRTWYESERLQGLVLDIAPVGGDWLAVLANWDGEHTMVLWQSTNGLNWTPGLDLNDLTGTDGPKTGRGLGDNALNGAALTGGSRGAFITLQNNHCCAQPPWNYGVWWSADGQSWTAAVDGDAFLVAVAIADGAEVGVGHLGRGDDAAFWIREH